VPTIDDTSPEARAAQEAVWRRLGPAGRVALMCRMSDEARVLTIAGIRHREPHLTELEAQGRMLRLVLGDELYEAAYVARGRIA
jgi:hypothetical protein